MNLLPLVNRIEAARLAVKEKSLFLQMFPVGVQEAVLLRTPLQGTRINHELPGFYHADFTVIVRCVDYDAGEVLMKRIMDLLTFGEKTIARQTFRYCRPQHLPVAFPLSDGNLIEYSVGFEACYSES
jgi:hypothetical protein